MAQMTVAERALVRRAIADETQDLREGMQNTLPAGQFLAEFPRMMYRKTDERDDRVISTDKDGKPREMFAANEFNGLLCDIIIVDSLDEAEALTDEGWDITPQAAHGVESGLAAVTSAKDDEIAALKAQLAEAQGMLEMTTAPAQGGKAK